jgi:two-component system nitrogen regulation sensor histidine kinase NtrY
VPADLDETMIGQALTNLIKNAGEAIESLRKSGVPPATCPDPGGAAEPTARTA